MPRKYTGIADKQRGGSIISPPRLKAVRTPELENVTAIDERDVSPLVDGARALREAVTVEDVDRANAEILEAFKPFEAEEGSG